MCYLYQRIPAVVHFGVEEGHDGYHLLICFSNNVLCAKEGKLIMV